MNNQWTDAKRIENSDYVIYNNTTLEALEKQVEEVYNKIIAI